MNKLFKKIITGIISAIALSSVVIGTAYASKHVTSFSTSTGCNSNNFYFNGLEGSSIQYIAINPNCSISGAKYQVPLWKEGGIIDTLMPDTQTKPVPANGLGSNFAWWFANANCTYHFYIDPFNNLDDNKVPQPITCLNVRFENFYDEDRMK